MDQKQLEAFRQAATKARDDLTQFHNSTKNKEAGLVVRPQDLENMSSHILNLSVIVLALLDEKAMATAKT